jgi:hypothetical protein
VNKAKFDEISDALNGLMMRMECHDPKGCFDQMRCEPEFYSPTVCQ